MSILRLVVLVVAVLAAPVSTDNLVVVRSASPIEIESPRLVALGRVDTLEANASPAPVLTADAPRAPPCRPLSLD